MALIQDEPTVMPPIGSETIDTPCQAMRPGGDELPGELRRPVEVPDVVGDADEHDEEGRAEDREHLLGFWKMIETIENRDEPSVDTNAAAPIAARMPRNIAMPPRRGVGRVCTSRSRIFG